MESIMETLGNVLLGLTLIGGAGLLIVFYVAWRNRRRAQDAFAPTEDMQTAKGGGGGPKPVK